MLVTDYNNIKKVTSKVPELTKENIEESTIKLFNNIKALREKIYTLRDEISKYEKSLKDLISTWELISPILDIEYETVEKEEIHNQVNIGFNFGSEINKDIH